MTNTQKTVAFYTLGCRVNQYETRAIEEAFVQKGYKIGDFSKQCDAYVINTCSVTGESDRKSRQMVRRAVKNGKGKAIVAVIGCMSEVDREAAKKIDGVSIVLGNGEKLKVVALVDKALNISIPVYNAPSVFDFDTIEEMSVSGSDNTRAFLKVVDGCENKCSYCIIPKARGRVRSKPLSHVLSECEEITQIGGCREIVLTGIETAAYGLENGSDLATLVEEVSKTKDLFRIRLGSLEPTVLKEDFVKRLSLVKSFMPHFHLSLQSGSDSVLARMKRKYNTEMFYEKLLLLRKYFPNCEITTDIIVGFPGETQQEFDRTLAFAEKCEFLYIHIFPYSERKGTAAEKMDGKVDRYTKQARCEILNQKMLEVRKRVISKYLNTKQRVLCETTKNGFVHGYTENFIEVRFEDDSARPNDITVVELCSIDQKNAEFVLGKAVK